MNPGSDHCNIWLAWVENVTEMEKGVDQVDSPGAVRYQSYMLEL